ncbi:MAG: UDP-N-acetylmuramate dehydrogenase [Gammaproteobacteria bacterium]|nr:MAG: UDP-N-acetylmuramate dehydrogenase [Gammaproteobacteria bacterium]
MIEGRAEDICRVERNIQLAPYTTWKIGGVADIACFPETEQELAQLLEIYPGAEIIGAGSNLLIRDSGIRGAVIILSQGLKQIALQENGDIVAEAGISCSRFAGFCSDNNLSGAEFLAGIPGTIGGALVMNAGAFGGEIWNIATAATVIERNGKRKNIDRGQLQIKYRKVDGFGNGVVIAGTFKLEQGVKTGTQEEIKKLIEQRKDKQPLDKCSCGSVFKNPVGSFAAKLIEEVGMKGFAIGDAQVSPKHANFIVNNGSASAEQIEEVMEKVIEKVRQSTGVELEPEVKIIGEKG